MKISKQERPPLNRVIWVSANNFTWFQAKVMYMGRNAFVYRGAYGRGHGNDVAHRYPFHVVFPQWKYKLDGTEERVE